MKGLPTSMATKGKPLASYSSPSVRVGDVALRTPAVSSKTTSTLCSFQVRETYQQRMLRHGLHWRYSSPPGTQSQVTLCTPCCSQCLDSPLLRCQSDIDQVPSGQQLEMDRIRCQSTKQTHCLLERSGMQHIYTLTHSPSLNHPHSSTLTHPPSLIHPHTLILTHPPSFIHPHSSTLTHPPSHIHPHTLILAYPPSHMHWPTH